MALCCSISIGLLHPLQEFSDSIIKDNLLALGYEPKDKSMEVYADRYAENIPDDYKYNYYSYDLEGNIFNKYIARKR